MNNNQIERVEFEELKKEADRDLPKYRSLDFFIPCHSLIHLKEISKINDPLIRCYEIGYNLLLTGVQLATTYSFVRLFK